MAQPVEIQFLNSETSRFLEIAVLAPKNTRSLANQAQVGLAGFDLSGHYGRSFSGFEARSATRSVSEKSISADPP